MNSYCMPYSTINLKNYPEGSALYTPKRSQKIKNHKKKKGKKGKR